MFLLISFYKVICFISALAFNWLEANYTKLNYRYMLVLQSQVQCHVLPYIPLQIWKCFFYPLAVIVQTASLIKCALFILRQISPRVFLPEACHEANNSNADVGQQYLFTMVLYSILFIGRWLETLIIHIHIYKFFFNQSTITPHRFLKLCKDGLMKNYISTTLLVILIVYMFIHSESVPALGIVLELQHGQEIDCKDYVYEYHVVYWLLDIIRYLHDVAIRTLMVLATIVIGQLWHNDELESTKDLEDKTKTIEPEEYADYLKDRDETSEDHKMRTKEYAQAGSEVERILEIFQTWFPIPWVLYFISASLDTDHILQSWKDGSSGEGHYDFAEISYMVYNFNQISLLTISFLCSKKMNTHHRNYLAQSRRKQRERFKTASRMAMASMNKIEKEEHFDFVPRIWGTSIKVPVESSLYIVTLLLGIFFTVCEALI